MKKSAEKKVKTFLYRGLGIPIKMVNVPMKKAAGVWCIDVNMNKLMRVVLEAVIHKPTALKGDELRYIRKQLAMTMPSFGKLFGVSEDAVFKWESGKNKVAPALELCIRLHALNHLHVKDKEFRNFYEKMSLETLSKSQKAKSHPFIVDAGTDELEIAL